MDLQFAKKTFNVTSLETGTERLKQAKLYLQRIGLRTFKKV